MTGSFNSLSSGRVRFSGLQAVDLGLPVRGPGVLLDPASDRIEAAPEVVLERLRDQGMPFDQALGWLIQFRAEMVQREINAMTAEALSLVEYRLRRIARAYR